MLSVSVAAMVVAVLLRERLAGRLGAWNAALVGGGFYLLAVLVATPCTAAFMGAAIAGALASPTPTSIALFATMGLGLAAPYVGITLFPGLTRALPRPGRWMDILRQLLAFPMYGAAVWLFWVLSQQAGSAGILTAGAGLLALGFAAWALGLAQSSDGAGRYLGRAGAAAGLLGSFVHAQDVLGLPLGLLVAWALSVAVFVTCGLVLGRPGAAAGVAGWLVLVLLLSTQRPEGDLVVAGTAVKEVVARAARERVVAGMADQHVDAAAPAAVHHRGVIGKRVDALAEDRLEHLACVRILSVGEAALEVGV